MADDILVRLLLENKEFLKAAGLSDEAIDDIVASAKELERVDTGELADGLGDIGDQGGTASGSMKDLSQVLGRLDPNLGRLARGLDGVSTGFGGITAAGGGVIALLATVALGIHKLTGLINGNAESQDRWAGIIGAVNNRLRELLFGIEFQPLIALEEFFRSLADGTRGAEQALEDLQAAQEAYTRGYRGSALSPEEMASQSHEVRGLTDRLRDYGETIDINSTKTRRNARDSQELRDRLVEQGQVVPEIVDQWANYADQLDATAAAEKKFQQVLEKTKSLVQGDEESLSRRLDALVQLRKELEKDAPIEQLQRLGKEAQKLVDDFEAVGREAPDALRELAKEALAGEESIKGLQEQIKDFRDQAVEDFRAVAQALRDATPRETLTPESSAQKRNIDDLKREVESLREQHTLTAEQADRLSEATSQLARAQQRYREEIEITDEEYQRAAIAQQRAQSAFNTLLDNSKAKVEELAEKYGAAGDVGIESARQLIDSFEKQSEAYGASATDLARFNADLAVQLSGIEIRGSQALRAITDGTKEATEGGDKLGKSLEDAGETAKGVEEQAAALRDSLKDALDPKRAEAFEQSLAGPIGKMGELLKVCVEVELCLDRSIQKAG